MTGEVKPGGGGYRWVVFSLLSLAYLMVYFHRTSPAVVAVDLMRDLETGGALIGFLGSAYFYPYALMQLPAGLLSDSWGPRRTITVFFLLAGAASIFFGLAQSVSWAILARVLVGLGVSMLFVPTMKVMTHWFKKAEFAMMTGVLMAVGGLGVLSAAYPLAFMSGILGWRGSFMAIGIITLVLAAAIWIFVRNHPEELGYPPVETAMDAGRDPALKPIRLLEGLKMVLGRGAFWPLAIWFFFICGVFFSFAGLWGGPYIMQVYGLTKSEAGKILSMTAIAMITGSPLLSYISDRVIHSRKVLMIASAGGMIALTAILAFAPQSMSKGWLYVYCFVLSICSGAIVVIPFTAAKELFPVSIAGTSVGAVNLFPFLGGAVMQPLLGIILDGQGPVGGPYTSEAYGKAFMVYFAASIIAFAAACLAKETHPAKAADTA